jgi:glycosyltransferase involved in cell wall biosynthesis
MTKPRILIISPVTPYPVHHGAGSTIYGYIRALREDFDILFAGFCPERFRSQAQQGLERLCRRAWLFDAPPARRLDAFSPTPFLFSNLQSDIMRRAVDRILDEERPDLVQVEYLGMARYAERARCPRIVRAHVLEWWHYYLNWQRTRGVRTRLENLFWCLDSIRHNRRTLESFDWVLVTSEPERERALELVPRARVEALPFFLLDCDYFRPAPVPPREPQMVFVGFLPHTPNEEALVHFIRQVLPLVRREEPRARLAVAGEGASNALRGLMYDHDVDYLDYVEDLRETYRRSRVYVTPINSGGGIRTKIVEAMAAGVPVVSSSFAPVGLGVLPGHHLLVADDPEPTAAAVVELLRDDGHWRRIQTAGRGLVENCFSLERVGPRIRARYRQFLEQATSTRERAA